MKNTQPFNSLVDNKDTILTAHLISDAKKRKRQWDEAHDDGIVWKFILGLIVVAVAIAIGLVELIF